jgi:O-antigen/teichoic acid export membrane protein
MTPIVVANLGSYDYGIWEMIGGIIGYMGVISLGVRPAVSRFASKYRAENNNESLLAVYSSTTAFMALVGSILCACIALFGLCFPSVFTQEVSAYQRYTALLLIIACQLLITFPGYVAESYLEGFQKYHVKNNISILILITGSIFLYHYINQKNGLLLLAAINAIGQSIKYIAYMLLLLKSNYGGLAPKPKHFSRIKLCEMIRFGSKSFIQGIATRVETATDVLVIGFILGPAIVPYYSIPANIAHYLRTFGWNLSHAFMPLFSSMAATNRREEIQHVYLYGSKYVVSIILAMAIGVMLVGGPFLGIWLGEDFQRQGDTIIVLLAIFALLPLCNPFVGRYLTAIGKHGILARLTPIAALINISLSVLLITPFGLIGVAIASVIPALIFTPIYLRYSCHQMGMRLCDYLTHSLLPCVIPAALLATVLLWFRINMELKDYASLILAIAYASFAWLAAFWFITLNKKERCFLLTALRKRNF